jgi:glycosyltransferase involved in cell wall biosynthesis
MKDLNICIVGGIFGKSIEYQKKHLYTPETVLANGLEERGYKVDRKSHYDLIEPSNYHIIHAHHVGRAIINLASSCKNTNLVFTSHNGPIICGFDHSIKLNLAYRYILSRCDAIVALSTFEHNKIINTIGEKNGEMIHVIPNGIPDNVFILRPIRPINSIKRILFVGQLSEVKGINILLKSFPAVLTKIDSELLLVYQTNKLEKKYKKTVEELGINNYVKFMGFLSSNELADLYSNVDLVVLPSYAEALPSVLTESLLSGTPVVASNVGGISEQINGFGTLVEPGNIKQLSDRIISALSTSSQLDYSKRLKMHDSITSRFNVENMVSKHIEMYENLFHNIPTKSKKNNSIDYLLKIIFKQENIHV